MSSVAEMPLSRGFDDYFGTLNGALAYFSYEIGNQCNSRNILSPDLFPQLWGSDCYSINGMDINDNGRPATEYKDSGLHYTQLLAEKAVEKISSHDSNVPLFMLLAPTAPHSPLEVTGQDAHRCSQVTTYPPNPSINLRSLVCQLMVGVDDMVGAVQAALEANSDMWNNTLLVYMSDNGGIKIFGSTNGGLRGQKGSYYEGGVRVPAFLSGGVVSRSPALRGHVIDKLVQPPDLFATMLTLAGKEKGSEGGLRLSCYVHCQCDMLLRSLMMCTLLTFILPGVNPEVVSRSDGQTLLLEDGMFNEQYTREVAFLGAAGLVSGSAEPGVQRPTAGVVFYYGNVTWKYTDFPNAFAFYGEYEPRPELGGYLFDLDSDPFETVNLVDSAASLHKSAVTLGMAYVDEMTSRGVPSPVDNANPPRMWINLIPSKYGCWIPPDSPYVDVDCGLGDLLRPYNTTMGQFLPTMEEKVGGSSAHRRYH